MDYSLAKKAVCEGGVLSEEDSKEFPVVEKVDDTARLPDGVHGQLGRANVDRLDTRLRSHHRSDCRAAQRVVLHNELLNGHVSLLGQALQNGGAHRVGHVALVSVNLDHNTFLHVRGVLGVVILLIIWVNRVRHISGEQEASVD